MKRVNTTLIIMILILSIFLIIGCEIEGNNLEKTNENPDSSSNKSLTGGVIICGENYECGKKDNVCPENYGAECKVKDNDC